MRVLFVFALVALCAADAGALPRRRAAVSYSACSTCTTATASYSGSCAGGQCAVSTSEVTTTTTVTEGDALAQVNAQRAARGLRPFLRDEGLTQAALACASWRANYRHPDGRLGLFGHTANDFAFVPPGCSASSAGCAAYPASYGFMACCVYDGYTYAGAAWVPGADGKMYCHIFVR